MQAAESCQVASTSFRDGRSYSIERKQEISTASSSGFATKREVIRHKETSDWLEGLNTHKVG